MTLKASWLFNGSAGAGKWSFGFSETWYTDDSPAALLPKMIDFAQMRTRILASGTELVGMRIADTTPGSRAYTEAPMGRIRARVAAGTPNVPQDAVLCKCFGTVAGTVKRFWFHCLPDDVVEDMEFTAASDIQGNVRRLINYLAANGFKFRYTVPTAASARVLSIDVNGNVLLVEPLVGVAVGSVVQLSHVRGVDGRGKRGKYYVETRTSDSSFKLAHWPGDVVAASGKIRLVQYGFTSIAQVPDNGLGQNAVIRPGTRKCGRPFNQLRGRAVARR